MVAGKPNHLPRAANRLRQSQRPEDPRDLEFELRDDCIPEGFLQGDVVVKHRRHLIFATKQQLDTLAKARVWYIDGTFKLVRHPFSQLLSINAFVRHVDHQMIPGEYLAVEKVVVDFEKAMWSALKATLPDANLMGCVFHWTQAVWRKVQELGFAEDDGTHRYIRQLMALPFLPATEIPRVFARLSLQATTVPLKDL
ncbi:hypothetical protein QZH41_018758, partial [Actinostola sp. cb2023]